MTVTGAGGPHGDLSFLLMKVMTLAGSSNVSVAQTFTEVIITIRLNRQSLSFDRFKGELHFQHFQKTFGDNKP